MQLVQMVKKVLPTAAVFLMLCMLHVSADIDDDIVFTPLSDRVVITVNGTCFPAGCRANIIILEPGQTFDNPSMATDEGALIDKIAYCDAVNDISDAAPHVFTFYPGNVYGVFPVKVTVTDAAGNTVCRMDTYYAIDPQELELCVSAFKNVTAEEFADVLVSSVEKKYLSLAEITSDYEQLARLGKYFVLARAGIQQCLLGDGMESFSSVQDVLSCIKAALVLEACEEKKEIPLAYAAMLDGLFLKPPTRAGLAAFARLYQPCGGDCNVNALCKNIRYYQALSYMADGTYEQVMQIIEAYADDLEIDVENIIQNGVTLYQVAKNLDTDFYNRDCSDIGGEVRRLVAKLKATDTRRTGGGGGGGGSASLSYQIPPSVEKSTEPDDLPQVCFQDLQQYSWAQEAIAALFKNGVIDGVDDNHFEPERLVKREEFVKMLVCAFSIFASQQGEDIFDDCVITDWYRPYVDAAVAKGVIKGVGQGLFGAGQSISRQDAAVVCLRVLKQYGADASAMAVPYTDVGAIDSYAEEAVSVLSQLEVFGGYPDGSFCPKEGVTRAQAAVMIHRMAKYVAEVGK